MTHDQFKALDELEQYQIVIDHGTLIGHKIENEYKIILYQLFSFYVELHYQIDCNSLKKTKVLTSPSNLSNYLKQFSNESLLEKMRSLKNEESMTLDQFKKQMNW